MECAIRSVIKKKGKKNAGALVAEAACGVSVALNERNERTVNYFKRWMLLIDLNTW